MKVLVTGATGFLGSRLTKNLLADGFEVYALGRNPQAGSALIHQGAKFVRADLGTMNDFGSLPKNVDAVVHCAALSAPWGKWEDFQRSNVVATEMISKYALEAKAKRFVHISSPSIYVDYHNRMDIKEDEPLPDISLNYYISTKRQAEKVIDQATGQGLPAITLRPQGLVGRGDPSILPRILKVAARGFVPRIGGAETKTDLTHVDNVVEAIRCALNAPDSLHGRKFNITNGTPVELYAFLENILKQLNMKFRWKDLSFRKAYAIASVMEWASRYVLRNKEPLLTRYSVCALGISRTLNIDSARKDLKYTPKKTLDDAILEILEDARSRKQ